LWQDRTGAEREVEFGDVLGPQIANELDQLVVGLRDNNEQKRNNKKLK